MRGFMSSPFAERTGINDIRAKRICLIARENRSGKPRFGRNIRESFIYDLSQRSKKNNREKTRDGKVR